MAKEHGKKYNEALKKIDRSRFYAPQEAVTLIKETSYTSFDATVEVHLKLGIDPRHADQNIRTTVALPHGTGKTVRVLVFAQGEAAQAEVCGCWCLRRGMQPRSPRRRAPILSAPTT